MRGKGLKVCEHRLSDRITPAYAGKRTIEKFANTPDQDHPRLCGEKLLKSWRNMMRKGSPPPMRGKDGYKAATAKKSRITPAYAGKRAASAVVICGVRDHPRLCGEKFSGIWENIKGVGSPPPMRGKVPDILRKTL